MNSMGIFGIVFVFLVNCGGALLVCSLKCQVEAGLAGLCLPCTMHVLFTLCTCE